MGLFGDCWVRTSSGPALTYYDMTKLGMPLCRELIAKDLWAWAQDASFPGFLRSELQENQVEWDAMVVANASMWILDLRVIRSRSVLGLLWVLWRLWSTWYFRITQERLLRHRALLYAYRYLQESEHAKRVALEEAFIHATCLHLELLHGARDVVGRTR